MAGTPIPRAERRQSRFARKNAAMVRKLKF
jgi:hypothetical protein